MTRRLDVDKAIQAVGVLLRREGKKATRLRVLKLLYIADRIALKETGSQILGSKVVAMKHGPLHSEVLDLINGSHSCEPQWSQFFNNDGKHLVLSIEPSIGKLSRFEIAILNKTVDDRAKDTDWGIVDETHSFLEWLNNYPDPMEKTSRPITLDSLLQAVGREADAAAIKQDIADTDSYNGLFAGIEK